MKYLKFFTSAGLALALSCGASQAQNVVMYTSYPIADIEIVQQAVKDQHGLEMSTVNGSSAVMLRRIEAESAKPAADLFWSAAAATITPFKEQFESYIPAELENIAENFHYQDHSFVPVGMGIIGLMINEDYLEGLEMPTKWADLAKPEWKGKVITSNPESGSTGYNIAYGLSQLLDEETYKAVVANMAVTESYRSLAPAVASGEYVITLVYEAASLEYIDGGRDEIKMIYPEDGVLINVEYAGIVKNAPNGEAGKKVIDTILSKDVQIKLLTEKFRRPVRSDIKISDYINMPELSDLTIFRFDEIKAAAAREATLATWRALPKGN